MSTRAWIVGCMMGIVGLAGFTSAAQAAPTSTGKLTLTPTGTLFKDKKKPVNLRLDVDVTPEPGAVTLKPLVNVKLDFPAGLSLTSHPDATPVCPQSKFGPDNANVPPDTARAYCPESIVGDGNADLRVGQLVSGLVTDPVLTLFNGGVDKAGNTIVTIHGYSQNLNQGIFMSGAVKDGVLSVDIPRLSFDTSVSRFQINIPGDIGKDKNYATASCPTGNWKSTATITLANRDASGTESGRETLSPPAVSNQPCKAAGGGGGGKAKLRVSVKGPKTVKAGHKATFKVTVKNKGKGAAKKVKVKASGGGKGSASAGTIKAGKSKTVKVKAKIRGKKGKKVTVKFRVSGKGVKGSAKAKVKIG